MRTPDAPDEHVPTNWGRWDPEDEHGTLNFIIAEARARGIDQAGDRLVVSLATPLTPVPLTVPPFRSARATCLHRSCR